MAAEAGQPRVPTDLLQDKQDRSTGGEALPVAWTDLVGYSPKLFFVVMPPDPGDSPPSEVSATIPDEPMLSLHVDHRITSEDSA